MKTLHLALFLSMAVVNSGRAADEITVRIGTGSVEIAKDQAEAKRFRDQGTRDGGIVLICKQIKLQRDATTYVVNCTDVRLGTAAGVACIAAEAQFDLVSNRVLLSGTQGKPVEIIGDANRDSDRTRLTAEKIEMELTPRRDPNVKNDTIQYPTTRAFPETASAPPVRNTPVPTTTVPAP